MKNCIHKLSKLLLFTCLSLVVCGCSIGHQQFYSQVAPAKYPPTNKLEIFEYANVEINDIYNIFFSDYLIIGKSSFNGPYENPKMSSGFAKSIGTDVFITSSQFAESKTSYMPLTTPTTNTTYVSGYSGGNYYSGTATSYGTQTTTVPITVNRYDQEGLYLKNVNSIIPLWERKKSDFIKDGESNYDGIWSNENYEIELFKSGGQIIGTVAVDSKNREVWHVNDVKLSFGESDNFGVYFMGDKTPMPANFEINKFGHLEVSLGGKSDKFSFAKK